MPVPNQQRDSSSRRALEVGIGVALLLLIAIGFVAGGGRGRIVELVVIAGAVAAGYAFGRPRAMLVAVLAAAAVLGAEAVYHRLGSSHAALAAAYALATAGAVLVSGRLRPEPEPWDEADRPDPGTFEYEFRRSLRHGRAFSLLLVHPDGRGPDLVALAARISETLRPANASSVGSDVTVPWKPARTPPMAASSSASAPKWAGPWLTEAKMPLH